MLLNIHTHLAQNELAIQNVIFHKEDIGHVPFSIGVHPWYLPKFNEQQMSLLRKLCQQQGCVLIGECGLDSTSEASLADQEAWFKYQIQLSEELCKPLILHVVRQQDRLLAIHQKSKVKQAWIVHGFNKNQTVAHKYLTAGFYLSFGHALLRSESLQATFKWMPLDQVFLETDEAAVTIEAIYQKAAEIKGIDVLSLAEKIDQNWKKIHLKQ